MLTCPKCKNEIQEDFSVCPYCGLNLYKKKSSSSKLVLSIIIGIVVAVVVLAVGWAVLSSAIRRDYLDSVRSCEYDMSKGMIQAEDAYNIIVSVWHNSIFMNDDPNTDMFTKDENGQFFGDFNDAMRKLFDDESFQKRLNLLNDNKAKVEEQMRSLSNPPGGLESLHADMLDVYVEYYTMIDLVLDPKGNYESYTSKFKEADEKSVEKQKRLSLYY